MLNNQIEPAIKLTDDQSRAIDETKRTLLNLESEISIASKNLKVTKADNEKLIKERIYQEELLNTITSKVNLVQTTLTELESNIADKTKELTKLNKKIETLENDILIKEANLKDREEKIIIEEKKQEEKHNSIIESTYCLSKEKEEFNLKVDKLKEVISQF